ncbi:MAG: 50S ribosomal protein L4 [Patescibacteria group bacterium]
MTDTIKNISVVDSQAKEVAQISVPNAALTTKIKLSLLHQMVVAYEANKRAGTAHTKTRAEVSGGGRKPWKQKGTGRARHGSIRSPLWKGGGVTFGPRSNRNYSQKINKKIKDQAIKMVVAERLVNKQLTVCQSYPQELKTKVLAGWLKTLGLANKKVLIILSEEEKKVSRALHNISYVELVSLQSLNPYDLIKKPQWLISEDSIKLLFRKLFKT